jgi:CheY-like chemotaxis protein/DNA-directed RNA polymerase subunit RPC12/RpoP
MKMAVKKQALEIKCDSCDTSFRLWIPEELLQEWDEGEEISCVKCGARFLVKKGDEGFEAISLKEEEVAQEEGRENVLIVEEDKLATAIAEKTLADVEINLLTARTGNEALEKVEKGGVDLIVTDLHLVNPEDPEADIDGEDLLRMVIDRGNNIPAIITTGKDMIDDLILDPKWFELRVKGFIQKGNPFWANEE